MTYFNPKIYNKQNLKESDLQELDYWNEVFKTIIDNAVSNYQLDNISDVPSILAVKKEIAEKVGDYAKQQLAYTMQDNLVSIVDNYDDDVEEIENPITYVTEYESEIEEEDE